MKTCVIACETIRQELEMICERLKVTYPIFWLESGLHNYPEKLQTALQKKINETEEYDQILLAMGYCGNSIAGVTAGHASMVIPRVDDCISLMIGSVKKRMELVDGCGTYFMTKGWLNGERNLWAEYEYSVKKYGEKRAKRIMKDMLNHYERLGILDMGAYPVEEILPRTEEIAAELGLRHEVMSASTSYIEKLLTGPWEEDAFLKVEPGQTISVLQLMKFY